MLSRRTLYFHQVQCSFKNDNHHPESHCISKKALALTKGTLICWKERRDFMKELGREEPCTVKRNLELSWNTTYFDLDRCTDKKNLVILTRIFYLAEEPCAFKTTLVLSRKALYLQQKPGTCKSPMYLREELIQEDPCTCTKHLVIARRTLRFHEGL